MRVQHAAQTVAGWRTAAPDETQRATDLARAVDRVRWRLWHGQAGRVLTLIGRAVAGLVDHDAEAAPAPGPAKNVVKLRRALETHVAGHAGMIMDYATARQQATPISTATTESAVQRLPHRGIGANQHMRWSPRI